ncbi:uncharacterized protein LOC126260305 [Schistocerca nitens]|uniref:uncharacterized protein LOC126260305 n=1 Tax=Schistocerca nitens TaxID=7011 RepID=UPI00211782FC|nr:uncharacterized protein LOC126260305 [Schistocerca nitens]
MGIRKEICEIINENSVSGSKECVSRSKISSNSFNNYIVDYVYSAILSVGNSDTLDIYNINSKIEKLSYCNKSKVLCHIINYCSDGGCFPAKLKVAKIIQIQKQDVNNLINNYRPVFLVAILSKNLIRHFKITNFSMEKIINM